MVTGKEEKFKKNKWFWPFYEKNSCPAKSEKLSILKL